MRLIRSIYSIRLELLLDLKTKIEQVNSFKLKLNSSIMLIYSIKIIIDYKNLEYFILINFKLSN